MKVLNTALACGRGDFWLAVNQVDGLGIADSQTCGLLGGERMAEAAIGWQTPQNAKIAS